MFVNFIHFIRSCETCRHMNIIFLSWLDHSCLFVHLMSSLYWIIKPCIAALRSSVSCTKVHQFLNWLNDWLILLASISIEYIDDFEYPLMYLLLTSAHVDSTVRVCVEITSNIPQDVNWNKLVGGGVVLTTPDPLNIIGPNRVTFLIGFRIIIATEFA